MIILGHVPPSDDESVVLDRELDKEESHDPSVPLIRCPLCAWSPREEDLWSCTCGHEWNTFDTGGVCPACLHQWTSTSASHAPAGRRIRIGMLSSVLFAGSTTAILWLVKSPRSRAPLSPGVRPIHVRVLFHPKGQPRRSQVPAIPPQVPD